MVNDPGMTVGRPDPTNDADTDKPSPETLSDELAPPAPVGRNTTVTTHVAPGWRTPPQPFAVIENGAAGGVTDAMLIAMFDELVTTTFRGAD